MVLNVFISIISFLIVVYLHRSVDETEYRNAYIVSSVMELIIALTIVYSMYANHVNMFRRVVVLTFVALTLYLSGFLKTKIINEIKDVSQTRRKYSQAKLLVDILRYIEIITIFILNVNMWLGDKYD